MASKELQLSEKYKEIDEELAKLDTNIFKVGNKDLSELFLNSMFVHEPGEKVYRTRYKLNKNELFENFELKKDFFIEEKYLYATYDNHRKTLKRQRTIQRTVKNISENKINKIQDIEEQEEDEEEIEKDDNLTINVNKNNYININKNQNNELLGNEKFPPDDLPIGEPPNINIELSDIDSSEEEESEKSEQIEKPKIKNEKINKDINELILPNESNKKAKNNLQFTEHILNQVKSPIDMINIGEKVYELKNKKDNSNEEIDNSPLTTYNKNHIINVQLFKYVNMAGQTNQFLLDVKGSLSDYTSQDQKEEVPTSMVLDNRDDKTNCSIWFGTNKATLIKIPICSKPSKECQGMIIGTEEVGITSIDIFENYSITGHIDGSIQILEDQKMIEKIKEIKIEILNIKFIKINMKKKKYEFIYSDVKGNVNFIKRAKILMVSRNQTEQILQSNDFPIYKISIFSKEKDLKIAKKKNMVLAMASVKNITLIKFKGKNENQKLAVIEIPYGNLGDFIFDCDFGYGFPPLQILNEKKDKISFIEENLINEGDKEKLIFIVCFGIVIKMFQIVIKNNQANAVEIGHYINDNPIYAIGFVSKSFIGFIDDKKNLKIINTFYFENTPFTSIHDPTNISILSYEKIDINSFDFLKRNNIFYYSGGNKIVSNKTFIGSVLISQKNVFILTNQKFLLYKLYQWDEVINNLCQDEQYYKMIWLSTFILGKNKNLIKIDSSQNINEEYAHSIQESLYIFLIKGLKEENKYKDLKMFIEYCINTGQYDDLYKAKETLALRKLDGYLYDYFTEYILNGIFSKFEFEQSFIKDFINYYLSKDQIIFLSKILLKISVNNLNSPEIIKILEEKELINPYICAQMREKGKKNNDYFKPIQYLYNLFEKKVKEEKEDEKIKEDYFKLITEHSMKYYYNKTLTCNDYIGHKLFWYIDKCISNEEYPKGNNLPKEAYEETCKKILLFLTLENVMEVLMKFDSFSYFNLLTRLFTTHKIYRFMEMDLEKKKFPYTGLESFIETYLGKISKEYLSEKYFYYQIKLFLDKTESFKNSFYIKYDFFQMTAQMCIKRRSNTIFIDRGTIIDSIKFLINYEFILESDKSKDLYDPFNCHKIPNRKDAIYKEFSENIENNILSLLQSLQNSLDFFETDLEELFSLDGLKNHNKVRAYLYEYGRKFEDLFLVKLDEYNNKDPFLSKEENIKRIFKWLNDIMKLTKNLDEKKSKNKTKYYHENFKKFVVNNLDKLTNISTEYLYNLIDQWYGRQQEDIIFSLKDKVFDELKYTFINKYLLIQDQQEEKDIRYEKYLRLKIDLLIRNDHKEQIIKVLEKYKILRDKKTLETLIENKVFDAVIYLYQKFEDLENCIKFSYNQIQVIFDSIKTSLLNYGENFNEDKVLIKLREIKKYLDYELTSCSLWTEKNIGLIQKDEIKNSWTKPLDQFYAFKNDLDKINLNNRLGIKYKSNNFFEFFTKIDQILLENIEYILNKMSDYIPLSIIVEILSEKFQNSKFIEYSKIFQSMFFSTRRTEEIFKSIINLTSNEIKSEFSDFMDETRKGICSNSKICEICKEKADDSNESNNMLYFKCGHIYHKGCCAIELGKYVCYICRIEEMDNSVYTDIPKFMQRKNENVIKNDNINELKKKREARKKEEKRSKLINKLQKIKNKRKEKLESFKTNIENIEIKI